MRVHKKEKLPCSPKIFVIYFLKLMKGFKVIFNPSQKGYVLTGVRALPFLVNYWGRKRGARVRNHRPA